MITRRASICKPPRHRTVVATVLGLVLLAHAWLLDLWRDAAQRPQRPGALPVQRGLSVRQIALAPAPLPEAVVTGRPALAAQASAGALPGARPPAPRPRVAARPPTPLTGVGAEETAALTGSEHAPAEDPPVYATRLPPPVRLQYTLRRGAVSGTAQLDWAWEVGRYRLSLHGHLGAAPQAAWISQGLLDAAGVAPERYTENRRGRELRAANFQREAGHISFSGPRHEYPLVAGAQDRLSWMIQLGAVLAANPDLGLPGAQVRVFVVGTRGDGETWVFTVQGRQALDLPAGHVPDAVHLQRQPRQPYDTQADIWLDPAQHHLPVRLQLRVRATGEGTLLELQGPQRPGP